MCAAVFRHAIDAFIDDQFPFHLGNPQFEQKHELKNLDPSEGEKACTERVREEGGARKWHWKGIPSPCPSRRRSSCRRAHPDRSRFWSLEWGAGETDRARRRPEKDKRRAVLGGEGEKAAGY